MDMIFKNFSVESKTVNAEAGIYEAMISTESVDRVGDVVRATGAKVDNYLKNPVVLWSHDYSNPPVAKAISLEIMPGYGIKATFQFPPRGASAQADTIHNLWAGKFINATSIGFMPIESKDLESAGSEEWRKPQDYVSWELLEFSLVPVPANQDALRMAMKAIEPPIEQKRGRVLSASNETKLRKAAESIQEVLAQVGEEPQQDALNDSTAEPITNPTSNNVSEAEQQQIAEKLTHIFGTWFGDE